MSLRTALPAAIALLLTSSAAHAGGTAAALFGFGTGNADDPETMHLSLRGEMPVAAGDVAAFTVVGPVDLTGSSSSGLGWEREQMALSIAPSARLRLVPDSVVRPYLDAGLGVIWRFSETDTWFGDATERQVGPMTRAALGVEIGGTDPGTVAFVAEPISYQRLGFNSEGADRISALFGITGAF